MLEPYLCSHLTGNSTTLDDPSELPAHERNDNNSSSEGYHSGNTPPSDSDGPVSSSSNTSDNEDEGNGTH